MEDVASNKRKMKELEDNLLYRLTSTQVCHSTYITSSLHNLTCLWFPFIHWLLVNSSGKIKAFFDNNYNVCFRYFWDFQFVFAHAVSSVTVSSFWANLCYPIRNGNFNRASNRKIFQKMENCWSNLLIRDWFWPKNVLYNIHCINNLVQFYVRVLLLTMNHWSRCSAQLKLLLKKSVKNWS